MMVLKGLAAALGLAEFVVGIALLIAGAALILFARQIPTLRADTLSSERQGNSKNSAKEGVQCQSLISRRSISSFICA